MSAGRARLGAAALFAVVAAGCAMPQDDERVGAITEPLAARCDVTLGGKTLDVEEDYLPHVVSCENGGAAPEALKVQAVAARTYLYFKLETSGSITDGQGDQVYTCGKTPSAAHAQAVKETAGEVLRYSDTTLAAFYVAGGKGSPPACKGDTTAATEKYVTYNEGKSGSAVTQTTLGFVSPTNLRNRGCMSQNGADCLAKAGKGYADILRFYYGADVAITRAEGACVPSVDAGAPVPDGGATADAGSDRDASLGPSPPPEDPLAGGGEGDEGCAVARLGAGAEARAPLGLVAVGLVAAAALARRRVSVASRRRPRRSRGS